MLPTIKDEFLVILDPGHGGMIDGVYQTEGKRSPVWDDGSQLFEGVSNRQIVHKVSKRLGELGIFNTITADEHDVPLRERVKKANMRSRHSIFISVHSDAFSDPSAHGYTFFTSKGYTRSDELVKYFEKAYKEQFPNERYRGAKEANFYVLKHTTMPAILIENFFMTNERECKEILMTEEGQDKIVTAIVNAIKEIHDNI